MRDSLHCVRTCVGGGYSYVTVLSLLFRSQEDIGSNTDQDEITFFRGVVTAYLERAVRSSSADDL